MGMSLSTKFNFYFEINENIAVVHQNKVTRCSNIKCVNHKNKHSNNKTKFCGECGKPFEQIIVDGEAKPPKACEFVEKYLDKNGIIYNAGEESGIPDNIWIYNYKIDFLNDFIGDSNLEYGGLIDLSKIDNLALIGKFKTLPYVKIFTEVFEREFGKGLFEIKFGIISYYN
jgi:hypothetical protein